MTNSIKQRGEAKMFKISCKLDEMRMEGKSKDEMQKVANDINIEGDIHLPKHLIDYAVELADKIRVSK